MFGEIRDYVNRFLKVETDISQDQALNAKSQAVIKFTITNTNQHTEFETDVVFEEILLKVGVPPHWHIEKAVDLYCGKSFSYEYYCNYDEIMKVQWAIEGRLSPAVLLTFYKSPNHVTRNNQLPISVYFDFLTQMNIHQWLERIKSFPAPNQNTTLAEMKSKEDILRIAINEMANTGQQIQDFLSLVKTDPYREDIIKHKTAVVEYLNRTQREIGELSQRLRNQNEEDFAKLRDNAVAKLTLKTSDIDKVTEELEQMLGIKTKTIRDKNFEALQGTIIPPTIPLEEIDLHQTPSIEDAIPLLEQFIRESYKNNVRLIRVIHGKGIGVLRKSVRLHLESHKLVKFVKPADDNHGGDGATEANLVDYNVDLI
jgi:DNA-nicking Smr family endonuclease